MAHQIESCKEKSRPETKAGKRMDLPVSVLAPYFLKRIGQHVLSFPGNMAIMAEALFEFHWFAIGLQACINPIACFR